MESSDTISTLISVPLIWVVLSYINAQGSGWRKLAANYPRNSKLVESKYTLATIFLKEWIYHPSFSNVGINQEVLEIESFIVFRLFHPPIQIPLEDIHIDTYFFSKGTGLELRSKKVPKIPIVLKRDLAIKLSAEIGNVWNIKIASNRTGKFYE